MWKSLPLTLLAFSSPATAQPVRENLRALSPTATESQAAPLRVRQVYRVKQQGGGLGVFVDEAVVFHEVGQGKARVWVVERRRRDQRLGKVSFRYNWIDGRECSALEGVIAAIGKLPPAAMAGLDTESQGWVSDTAEVTLIGPSAGGRIGDQVLRRDLMGPVSRWWWQSQNLLEPCWQDRVPYIPGAYDLRPRLTSAQDEVEVMRP